MRIRPIVALCMALFMVLCGMAAHAEQPAAHAAAPCSNARSEPAAPFTRCT